MKGGDYFSLNGSIIKHDWSTIRETYRELDVAKRSSTDATRLKLTEAGHTGSRSNTARGRNSLEYVEVPIRNQQVRRTLTRPSARKSALVSLGTHVVLFVAMAIWPKSFVDRISFAGRQEAIQLVGVFTTAVTPPYDASILPEFHAPEESAAHERDVTRRNNDVEKLSLPDQAEPSRQPAPDPLDLQSPNHVSADVTSVSVANSTARRAPAKQLQSVEPLEFQFSRRTFHPPTPSSVASVAGVAQVAGVEEDRSSDFASNAPPIYPAEAVRKRWEGTVLLRLHVTATGEVSRLEVIESSGHAVLDDAAVEAVRHWRGKPSRRRGQPVATVEILPIRFRL